MVAQDYDDVNESQILKDTGYLPTNVQSPID